MGAVGRILKRKPLPPPNTFLGGMGATFPTAASIAGNWKNILTNNIVSSKALKRYTANGPNNEISYYKRGTVRLNALNAFQFQPLTYVYDIDGKIRQVQQGSFRGTPVYRFHLPKAALFEAPSGYFTLNGVQTRGYLYLPGWTGEGNNQNHIWNSASSTNQLDVLYAPKLTRLTLQPISRANFSNQTAIRRIVMPRVRNMSAQNNTRIFTNVNPSAIFYLAKEMSYYVQGNENIHVTYWKGRGCEIRYVDNEMKPDAVNDLTVINPTLNSVDITFTPVAANPNSVDGYEVWVEKVGATGEERYTSFVPKEEALASGHTINGLEDGTTYKIKLRTFDFYYNLSDFSNEVEITLSAVGSLVGNINGTSFLQNV